MKSSLEKKKRSSFKRASKEAKVLRFMRKTKGLSMRKAGAILNRSDSLISHLEHGRFDLTPEWIELFVEAYGFSMEEFKLLMENDEEFFEDYREELIQLIQKMDDAKILKIYKLIQKL